MDTYQDADPRYAPPEPPRTFTARNALFGCLFFVLLCFVFMAGCSVLSWNALVEFGINQDLIEYQSKIRGSGLEPQVAEDLAAQLDRLRDRVSDSGYGILDWTKHDTVIQEILEDGEITPSELERLRTEISRIESGFKVPSEPAQPPQVEAP